MLTDRSCHIAVWAKGESPILQLLASEMQPQTEWGRKKVWHAPVAVFHKEQLFPKLLWILCCTEAANVTYRLEGSIYLRDECPPQPSLMLSPGLLSNSSSRGAALPAHPAASQLAMVTEETVPSVARCLPSSCLDLSLAGKGAVTLTGSDTHNDTVCIIPIPTYIKDRLPLHARPKTAENLCRGKINKIKSLPQVTYCTEIYFLCYVPSDTKIAVSCPK